MKIRSVELAPSVPPTGNINPASRGFAHRQASLLYLKNYSPYSLYKEESITLRETQTGTYEVIAGNDAVILERACRKGQVIDFWI